MTDRPLPTPLALLGLGIIGARVADHLGSAGYPLSTWSRSPREREDFETDPAQAAGKAEVILLFLKDAPAVRQAFAAVQPQLGPGKSLINHATIDLETTSFLEDGCRATGCNFLNAPFTGSKNAAADGKLVSEQMAALDLEGRGEDDFSVLNSQFHRDHHS